MPSDLDLAFKTINDKRPVYDLLWKYYDGDAPLKYSTERLRKAFETVNVYFAENWLSVVVSAVLDRLTLKGFSIKPEKSNTALDAMFNRDNMQLTAYDAHEAALVTSESFVIAERDEEGNVTAYYNDPRLVHVFYDPAKPRTKRLAAKYWQDDTEPQQKHIALYYPDRTEFYTASKNASTARGFTLTETQPNDTGKIPVFHFRTTRRGRGEFWKAEISQQDAVNKLFSDMMVASEFTSMKQRVIISKADPGDLHSFENWYIPDNDAKVQEIGGIELTPFLTAMDHVAQTLAIVTRTPKHFLFQVGQVPSGDALIAMEAPLAKKTLQRQENFSVTWAELISYLLELSGQSVEPDKITATWEPVETVQPMVRAQILQTETGAGVPLRVSAKRQGWAEDEIKQLPDGTQQQQPTDNNLGA